MSRAGGFGKLEAGDPERVGRYRTVALLGEGGMGRVYLALSPGGRWVAVKVIRPDMVRDHRYRDRFTREVAAARAVSGVFTAAVVDADTEATPPWLATEYVPGVSLNEAVTGARPLREAVVWRLAAGLAEALEAIHGAGIVHRDLKPSNVLLAADGPRVIDFGISVTSEAGALTTTGVAVGTPGFMAPEQLTDEQPVGPATDVFALGCVLTFAATGAGPFGDGPSHAVTHRIVHQEPRLERLPEALRGIVAGCLQKDPRHRLEVGDLLRMLEGRAAAAPDPSAGAGAWLPGAVAELVTRRVQALHPPTALDPAAPGYRPAEARTAEPATGADPEAETRTAPRPKGPAGPGPAGGSRPPRPPEGSPAAGSKPAAKQTPPRPRTRSVPGPAAGASASPPAAAAPDWGRRAVMGLGGAALAGGVGYGGWYAVRWVGGVVRDLAPDLFMADSEQRWVFTEGMDSLSPDDSSPAVSGGTVYVGAEDGSAQRLYAFDAATGRRRWSFRTRGRAGSPAVSSGSLYLADDNNYLYALDSDTGRSLWTVRLDGSMQTSAAPRVADSTLYATSASMSAQGFQGYVYAFDIRDGDLRWRFGADSVIRSSPCLSAGAVFVGSYDHKVYSLDAATGRRRWTFTTRGQVGTAPVVSGGTVYVGSDDHRLYALDAATGRKRWEFAADGPVASSPAVSGDVVCVAAGLHSPGSLYGVDAATGHRRWKTAFSSGIASAALTASAGQLYLGVDGHLYALDARTGRRHWKFAMGAGDVNSASVPAVAGSVVYISGWGAVYAVSQKGKGGTARPSAGRQPG